MHLIVQYHDPLLSSHLESHKVTAFEYGRPFFAALFAPEICKQSLYVVWDKLFERVSLQTNSLPISFPYFQALESKSEVN